MTSVAWAPHLPGHWSRGSLKWLAQIYSGGTPDRTNDDFWHPGAVPWLNSGSVNKWVITEPSELISQTGLERSSARWVPAGAIVMALAGQGRTKGLVARMGIPATINQSMVAIVPGAKIDATYLQYWLASNYQSIRHLAGGEKRDGLNQDHVGSIECPVPPLTEQHAIGGFLDRETAKIDALIAKQEQLITTLELRERALCANLLRTSAEVGHATARRDDLFFDAAQPLVPLRKIVSVRSGSAFPPSEQGQRGHEIDFLKVKHLGLARNGYMPRSEDTITAGTAHRLRAHVFPRGTLAYAKVGAALMLSRLAILQTPSCLDNNLSGLMPRADVVPEYLRAALSMVDFGRYVNPGPLPSLNEPALLQTAVPLPKASVQMEIVDSISRGTADIRTLISKAERFIELSKERRAALITAAVTGQIDVSASSSA